MSYINYKIYLKDIIYNLDSKDRRDFFLDMQEEGYISDACEIDENGFIHVAKSYETDDFNLALEKLRDRSFQLTTEEEQLILKIANRF